VKFSIKNRLYYQLFQSYYWVKKTKVIMLEMNGYSCRPNLPLVPRALGSKHVAQSTQKDGNADIKAMTNRKIEPVESEFRSLCKS
jgi:hypothetical protein